jgi:proteasome lid subunit RPN8/RPN11
LIDKELVVATEPSQRSPKDGEANPKSGDGAAEKVSASGWTEKAKVRRRTFPGPAGAQESLRIAMTRDAYAELTAHAKESLNAEICGVLVGELCEDGEGQFVSVEGTIRGTAAKKGSTHVTFTQETWNQIHEEKDRDHPKRQIVGWYHTHPGFGVEFSEMDMFIQRNFFSGASQIAFVTDPLGGQEAILVNAQGEILPVSRFWVDGREKRCHGAGAGGDGKSDSAGAAMPASVDKAIKSLDERIGQLMQMVDAQAASMQRFLLTIGMIVATGVCLFLAYNIYYAYVHSHEIRPPEMAGYVPVPVQMGDKTVMLGVGIVKWEVPPELNAILLQYEREKQQAAEAAAAAAKKAQPATAPANGPTTVPGAAPATAPTGK